MNDIFHVPYIHMIHIASHLPSSLLVTQQKGRYWSHFKTLSCVVVEPTMAIKKMQAGPLVETIIPRNRTCRVSGRATKSGETR